jgi:hypothetical protein
MIGRSDCCWTACESVVRIANDFFDSSEIVESMFVYGHRRPTEADESNKVESDQKR